MEMDPGALAELTRLLSFAPGLFDRSGELARAAPEPNAPSVVDAASPLGHHVRILANETLATSTEHFLAWHHLLTRARIHPIGAHMTLLRGTMEGAVTCRWLTDPQADNKERVRRGVALLADDYRNRADFERDIGLRATRALGSARTGTERLKELTSQSGAAGIKPGASLGMTSRFDRYAVPDGPLGRSVFRLLSAYAHGKQWSALTANLGVMDRAAGIPGGAVARVSSSDHVSVTFTGIGLRTALAAVRNLEAYLGVAPADFQVDTPSA